METPEPLLTFEFGGSLPSGRPKKKPSRPVSVEGVKLVSIDIYFLQSVACNVFNNIKFILLILIFFLYIWLNFTKFNFDLTQKVIQCPSKGTTLPPLYSITSFQFSVIST